jgi:hypothetical protein
MMGRGDLVRQWEHFRNARRVLMAPHDEGEPQAFVYAFEACRRALFPAFDDARIDDDEAREAMIHIRCLTDGGGGLTADAARASSDDDRRQFADAVDTLATYFDRAVWCSARDSG